MSLKAIGLEGDVRKQEDATRVVESTYQHFGRIDILVNSAAGNFLASAEDLSPNGFRTGDSIIIVNKALRSTLPAILSKFECALAERKHFSLFFFFAVLDIDAVGTFTMCHAALKYLKKGGPGRDSSSGGSILNISATLHYTASWYQIHVSAAKVIDAPIFVLVRKSRTN